MKTQTREELEEEKDTWKRVAVLVSIGVLLILVYLFFFYIEINNLQKENSALKEQINITHVSEKSISFWINNGTQFNQFACIGNVYWNGELVNVSSEVLP